MKLENYFIDGKVIVWKECFAVIKSKKADSDAFTNIVDKNEITVIINQDKLNNKDIIEIEKDWKIITFDMVLPFGLVGFLAKISSALAEQNISIFVISAFSTDHLLVKKKDITKTKAILKKLGFIIMNK
jgi:hypothetical protein